MSVGNASLCTSYNSLSGWRRSQRMSSQQILIRSQRHTLTECSKIQFEQAPWVPPAVKPNRRTKKTQGHTKDNVKAKDDPWQCRDGICTQPQRCDDRGKRSAEVDGRCTRGTLRV